jgi:amidase
MKKKMNRNRHFRTSSIPILFFSLVILLIQGCKTPPSPQTYQAPEGSMSVSGRPIVFMAATEMAAAIRSGQISSVEVVSAHLNHIHKYNPALNAIVIIDEEAALKRAREADAALAKGDWWGPLHGVPVTIKDHFAVKGMRTTNAFPPLADQVTDYDATVVKRLKDAGAIILGKTNLPVLAMDTQTFNPIFGRTNNPWDLARTTGGSTGGGAAAVASGLSPLEIGSDIGGSIRIPSSFCGVYGIKTTENFVSSYGIFPGLFNPERRTVRAMASIGPLARSIDDLKLALSIIAGPDGYDVLVPVVKTNPPPLKTISDLRIAWSDNFSDVAISQDTRRVLTDFIKQLTIRGCVIEQRNPDHFEFKEAWKIWGQMMDLQINANLPSPVRFIMFALGGIYRSKTPLLQMVYPISYDKYIQVSSQREIMIACLEKFFSDWDVFICPVTTRDAFPHMEPSHISFGYNLYDEPIMVDDKALNYWTACLSYTSPFNMTGHPVVVIPAGYSKDGMPIGVQIVGRRWHDMELLDMAKLIDAAAGNFKTPNDY